MNTLPRHSNGHPMTGSDHRADVRLLVDIASDGTVSGGFVPDEDDFERIVREVEESYDALRTDD